MASPRCVLSRFPLSVSDTFRFSLFCLSRVGTLLSCNLPRNLCSEQLGKWNRDTKTRAVVSLFVLFKASACKKISLPLFLQLAWGKKENSVQLRRQAELLCLHCLIFSFFLQSRYFKWSSKKRKKGFIYVCDLKWLFFRPSSSQGPQIKKNKNKRCFKAKIAFNGGKLRDLAGG